MLSAVMTVPVQNGWNDLISAGSGQLALAVRCFVLLLVHQLFVFLFVDVRILAKQLTNVEERGRIKSSGQRMDI